MSENPGKATEGKFAEAVNRGTRHETAKSSSGYGTARAIGQWRDPFIVYAFSRAKDARQALLGVSCVHVAADTGKLICTELVDFGCYRADDGKFIAMMCGFGLIPVIFEEAKASFKKRGGSPRNAGESPPAPERVASTASDVAVRDHGVRFVETRVSWVGAHHMYRAGSKRAALEFLERSPVKEAFVYMVVETPDGDFGRDCDGMYVAP